MILQLCILGIVTLLAPLVPPILSPLGYSLTAALLIQKADPRTLIIITVGISTLGTIIIRKAQNYIIPKLTLYEKTDKKDVISRIIKRINRYFRKQEKIGKIGLKREKYIETKTGRFATFFFAILCFIPIIPDIISTRILYKKIKFPYFVLAAFIGKSITHIPFILFGKGILQLLHIQR